MCATKRGSWPEAAARGPPLPIQSSESDIPVHMGGGGPSPFPPLLPSLGCVCTLCGAASVSLPSSGPPRVSSTLPVPSGAPRGKTQAAASLPLSDLLSPVQRARAADQTGAAAHQAGVRWWLRPSGAFLPGRGRTAPPGYRGPHPEHGPGSVEASSLLFSPEPLHPEGSPIQSQCG
ncbi:hypothetical protein NDU88_001607 [Pleurodeles waltl]|uniref:Uncharacterized protein n=1 Tax=Pleurodeles waltl TaxID=8319 RepID=A0AAV7T0D3_PLEWA|nr:hypothetical protein NDU88_001607 [Pleurodeles waltl]